jgi:hypothetical protein
MRNRHRLRTLNRLAADQVRSGKRYLWHLASPATTLFSVDRALDCLPRDLHRGAVWVPTDAIEYDIAAKVYYGMPERFVQDGEWDVDHVRRMSIHPTTQRRTIEDVVLRGVPLHETHRFQELSEQLERDGSARGMRSVAEFDSRYVQPLIKLFEDIRAHGVKSAKALRREGVKDASNILVLIDRNGSPVLLGGKHRFAICQLLGLPKVPVEVLGGHRTWTRRCIDRFGRNAWTAVNRGIRELGNAGTV